MRLAWTAVLCALLACDANEGSGFDAATPDAAPEAACNVCTQSIDAYCAARACPASEDAAVAQLCNDYSGVVAVCGGVVVGVQIDVGSGYVFDGGALTTAWTFNNGRTCCVAGPIGSNVDGLACALSSVTSACASDAGDQ